MTISPERNLWQTVLIKAVLDATADKPHGYDNKRAKREATAWLSRNSKDFRKVCDLAGMDASMVRSAFVEGRVNRALLKAAEGTK